MGKKTKAITIHLSEEIAQLVEFNAREERRPVAQLLALWVEDVARVETMKKCDKGAKWRRPQFAPNIETPEFDTLAELIESEKGEANR